MSDEHSSSRSPANGPTPAAASDGGPGPTFLAIEQSLIDIARERPGIRADDHVAAAIDRLGVAQGAAIERMVDEVLEEMVGGPLHWLPGDLTVHVPSVVHGATFTHRLNEFEREIDVLTVGFDAGAFSRFDTVVLDDGTPLDVFSVEFGHLAWRGPEGWLNDHPADALLAITASVTIDDPDLVGSSDDELGTSIEAVVTITVVDEPDSTTSVAQAVQTAYDDLVAEPGLPVSGEDLGLWLAYHRRDLFDEPQAPLGEVCDAIGLEQRGGFVAHDPSIWRQDRLHQRLHAMMPMVPERKWQLVLGRAFEVLDDPDASVESVRSVLDECAAPEVIDVLADVLIPHWLDLDDAHEIDTTRQLVDLVDRATALARRPREVATAEYLACVLHERSGAPEVAEARLARAIDARPRLGPVIERMGWYRFDRGDARGAMRWWRQLSELPEAAETIVPFADSTGGAAKIGRNDPCWCGSGRKFKQCHLGSAELPALPDRVGWLARKATTWLEHSSGEARGVVTELVAAYVSGDPDADPVEFLDLDDAEVDDRFEAALSDPIIFDAALHEDRLFSLFLHERGPLLPDDEQLLAAAWKTVERSVHEVVDTEPGVGMILRDLASGDELDVRERTLSHTAKTGERYCARVVPDGATHQILGGLFPVRAGHESGVLDLCARRDAMELCAWVGALYAPPRIVHRPGLFEESFDREAIETTLAGLGSGGDPATTIAALSAELSRQARTRWLDEHVPALGGLTPREAAADPTRREQLERLLAEFDDRSPAIGDPLDDAGFIPIDYDVPALRRELGLE